MFCLFYVRKKPNWQNFVQKGQNQLDWPMDEILKFNFFGRKPLTRPRQWPKHFRRLPPQAKFQHPEKREIQQSDDDNDDDDDHDDHDDNVDDDNDVDHDHDHDEDDSPTNIYSRI